MQRWVWSSREGLRTRGAGGCQLPRAKGPARGRLAGRVCEACGEAEEDREMWKDEEGEGRRDAIEGGWEMEEGGRSY